MMPVIGGSNKACAACKYQRRRCSEECPLAPYFPSDQPEKFSNAHRLFGVANIKKILDQVDPRLRDEAMKSIVFESDMRKQFPSVGCLGVIWNYKQQIAAATQELHHLKLSLHVCREQFHRHVSHQNSPPMPLKSIPCCADAISMSMWLDPFQYNNNEGAIVDGDGGGGDGGGGSEVVGLQQSFTPMASQPSDFTINQLEIDPFKFDELFIEYPEESESRGHP